MNEVLSSVEERILRPMRTNPSILISVVFALRSSVVVGPSAEDNLPSPSSHVLCLLMEKVGIRQSGPNPSSVAVPMDTLLCVSDLLSRGPLMSPKSRGGGEDGRETHVKIPDTCRTQA